MGKEIFLRLQVPVNKRIIPYPVNILVLVRHIASVNHVVNTVFQVYSFFFFLINFIIPFFSNGHTQIHIHKIHSFFAMDIDCQLFLPGRTEPVSQIRGNTSCRHIAKQLVSKPLPFDKLRSDHTISLFLILCLFPFSFFLLPQSSTWHSRTYPPGFRVQ